MCGEVYNLVLVIIINETMFSKVALGASFNSFHAIKKVPTTLKFQINVKKKQTTQQKNDLKLS